MVAYNLVNISGKQNNLYFMHNIYAKSFKKTSKYFNRYEPFKTLDIRLYIAIQSFILKIIYLKHQVSRDLFHITDFYLQTVYIFF